MTNPHVCCLNELICVYSIEYTFTHSQTAVMHELLTYFKREDFQVMNIECAVLSVPAPTTRRVGLIW